VEEVVCRARVLQVDLSSGLLRSRTHHQSISVTRAFQLQNAFLATPHPRDWTVWNGSSDVRAARWDG
jgi:hypothetical protein